MSDPGNPTPEEVEIARLNEELSRKRQRGEDVLKSIVMVALDMWPPDDRPKVFAQISAQILEKLARRDTQRTRTGP